MAISRLTLAIFCKDLALKNCSVGFIKIARIALIALCFILFGIICLVGNLFFVPLILLGLQRFAPIQNLSRDIVRFSWGFFLWCAKMLGAINYSYSGFDKLDSAQKSQILIANHPSLLDVVLIIARIRHINCVVKDSLRKNPFLFAAIRASGYIRADESLLENSLSALYQGESLLIFPEGTRTKDSIIFHKAASYIAINGAKNLAVIFIKMRPLALKKGEKWYDTPREKLVYDIALHKILDLQNFANGISNPLRVRKLHSTLSDIYKEEFDGFSR